MQYVIDGLIDPDEVSHSNADTSTDSGSSENDSRSNFDRCSLPSEAISGRGVDTSECTSIDTENSFSESNFVYYYLSSRETQLSKWNALNSLKLTDPKAYEAKIAASKLGEVKLMRTRAWYCRKINSRMKMILLIVNKLGLIKCLANPRPFKNYENDTEVVYRGLRYTQCILHVVISLGGLCAVLNSICTDYLFQRKGSKVGSSYAEIARLCSSSELQPYLLSGEHFNEVEDLQKLALCTIIRSIAEYHRVLNVVWIMSEISITLDKKSTNFTAYYHLLHSTWKDCWKWTRATNSLMNSSNGRVESGSFESNTLLALVATILSGSHCVLAKDIHEWGFILEEISSPQKQSVTVQLVGVHDCSDGVISLHEALSMPIIVSWVLNTYYLLGAKVLYELPESFKNNNCLSLFHVVQEWLLRLTSVRLENTYKQLQLILHNVNTEGWSSYMYPSEGDGHFDVSTYTLLKYVTIRLCPSIFKLWSVRLSIVYLIIYFI